jgi:hypothetical protein
MKTPVSLLPLAVVIGPLALSLSACKTIYSDVYSYRKNYFDPYESRETEKRQLEMAKRQAETARLAAMKDAQSQVDRLDASGANAPLQLDAGLGAPAAPAGLGSSIPGLGASPGTPSLGAIPGLDAAPAAPAAPGAAMGAGGEAMGGGAAAPAPAAPAPKPAAPLPGL